MTGVFFLWLCMWFWAEQLSQSHTNLGGGGGGTGAAADHHPWKTVTAYAGTPKI